MIYKHSQGLSIPFGLLGEGYSHRIELSTVVPFESLSCGNGIQNFGLNGPRHTAVAMGKNGQLSSP